MADASAQYRNSTPETNWLKAYYFARAAVSLVWVAAALTVGKNVPVVGNVLLFAYPAWDAIANIADLQGNGGWKKNPTRRLTWPLAARQRWLSQSLSVSA